MQYLGIDVGTSFIKGGVLDIDDFTLGPIEKVAAPDAIPGENGMFHEIDPAAVVLAVRKVIDRLLSATDTCTGIVVCGQMGGLVLTDDSSRAKSNYISWLDRRLMMKHPMRHGSYFDRFLENLGTTWPARLGNELRPGLTLPFLYWLEQNRKLINGTIPVTLPDFVAANLCGVKPVMEWTSCTSLLDIQTRSFPAELFEQLKLNKLEWPRIVDFRHQVGHYESESAKLPVFAPVGDHQCALAGSFLQEGDLSINVSTGSQVAMIINDMTVGEYQVRPYFDGAYLKTVTNIPAGRALTALVKLFTEIPTAQGVDLTDPWGYAFRQAESTTRSDVSTNLAFFPSAVAGPGQLGNLHEGNLSVGNLFHAALAQMAEYYEQFATKLSSMREWDRIVFSGGIAQRSNLLRRLICQRLGDNYRLTSSTEDVMLGLMVLARVISGRNQSVREASQDVGRHFGPTISESSAPI